MLGLENRFTGDLVEVITNPHGLYEGDLRHYARVVFSAPNIHNGYHGLRHMLHVTWVCYKACEYYARLGLLGPRRMRSLLIAALLHDYGHTGRPGNDANNIKIALDAMHLVLLPEDFEYFARISNILCATQYPHKHLGRAELLEQSIIRDADMSQAFGGAWIGEIVAGFGSELGKTPLEMLEQQLKFLQGVHFSSDFGKIFFGQDAVKAKVRETEALIEILTV